MRRRALVAALLVAICALTSLATQAAAQEQPQPTEPGPVIEVLTNPGAWLTTAFNAMLVTFGEKTTSDAVGFMNFLLGSGNVVNQTPPALSYDSEAVRRLWDMLRWVGNGALAVVTVVGGANMMIQPHIRAPYHGALELVPRVLLGAVLVNSSLDWGRFVIDLNNALCQAIGSVTFPAWNAVQQPDAGTVLINLIAMTIYLVMGMLLFAQMLMRLALVDVLLILAPLALLCWVLPQTYAWARLWFGTFVGTVFVQFVQVLVLQLGGALIEHLPGLIPGVAADPLNGSRVWLMTLLLGVAVLQLARRVPKLMPGFPAAADAGSSSSGRRSNGRQPGPAPSAAARTTVARGR